MRHLLITELFVATLAWVITIACGDAVADEPPVRIETVPIEGAEFTMGTPLKKGQPEYHDDETPLSGTVNDFRIGKYPVTAEQMCEFLNSPEAEKHAPRTLYNHRAIGEYRYSTIALTDDGQYIPRKGAAKAPANQVTWKGAALFCVWLSDKAGRKFRLPSEAEWELAARGEDGRQWPWGNQDPGPKHGERYGGRVRKRDFLKWTKTPVGSYPANATPDGMHDILAYIIGEWCANKYRAHPTPEQATDTRVDLDDLTSRRVVRGYYHRYYPRGGFLLQLTEYGWKSHLGRPWTRVGFDPIKAPEDAARFGFRLVEETRDSKEN